MVKTFSITVLFLLTVQHLMPVLSIIGGKTAPDFPFFVLVLRRNHRCGGTIVFRSTILTAANCLYDQEERRWALNREIFVFHGNFSTPNEWMGTTFAIERYEAHHLYRPHAYNKPSPFDIALIKLQGGLQQMNYRDSVLPICYRYNYKYGLFIGLGLVSQTLLLHAAELMETVLQRDEECGKYHRVQMNLNKQKQFCYSDPGRTYVCHGDIGGPLIASIRHHNTPCLLGISSYVAETCTNTQFPPVFTSVSAFGNWVYKKTRLFRSQYNPTT